MTWSPECPVERTDRSHVVLAHGEGGRLSRRLVQERILPHLGNAQAAALDDAVVLPRLAGTPVMTTDGFVVSPLFFPGGDIGTLAVYGTVNDLAVAGARPGWLSLSLILEEGLPLVTLDRVLASIATAAQRARVAVVTGDTKVVPRGMADQLFITTTGLGELLTPAPPGPTAIQPTDELLVSGPIGRHGIAVLSAREDLGFAPPPISDCAPLIEAVGALRSANIPVRAMRDATRGGLAAVLHEWAVACRCTLEVDEGQIPVTDAVRGICELLGLDPLFVACEGTMAVAVAAGFGEAAVQALRCLPEARQAAVIGRCTQSGGPGVAIHRLLGRLQPLDDPAGQLLPRIC
jgi:hydrogenase expression/formation protein HypE